MATLTSILPGRLQATYWPGGRVPADGHLAWWGTDDPAASAKAIGLPTGRPATFPTVMPASPGATRRVAAADVPARVVPVRSATRALAAMPGGRPEWERPGDSVRAWSVAAKLALELIAAGRLVPALRPAGPGETLAYWRLAGAGDSRITALAQAFPVAGHALRRDEDDETIWPAGALLAGFLDAVADTYARGAPRGTGPMAALTGEDPLVELADGDLPGELAEWAVPVVDTGSGADGATRARLCLRLLTADDPEGGWPLTYHLQAADDPSLLIPADQIWDGEVAGIEDAQEALVTGLAEAARLYPPIDVSLSELRPVAVELTREQAGVFLTEGAPALASAGLSVLLPAELTAKGARRLRARMRVVSWMTDPGAGITPGQLGVDGLARFRWEPALGEDTLSAEEFDEIVALKQPLVRWKGEWVRLDVGEVPRLTSRIGEGGELSGAEALSLALAGQGEDAEFGEVDVVADGALRDLIERLRSAGTSGTEPRLVGVEAELRDYQKRGVAWLQTMADLGLGAVLADDMGLGKTLQTIALLAGRDQDRPHLVVCPTSVVGNWERELARFAPYLPVIRHHGPERVTDPEDFKAGSVVVTSYGLLRRDLPLLEAVGWDTVVLDEAQQIKNQAAQTARAAKRLRASVRVALTGTPVENRLSELWSIMDFVNPGLLGPFHRFREGFAVPIELWRDPDVTARLRRTVAPFMLRRVKTDPAVAADLPPKVEAVVACALTREQATLYRATVKSLLEDIDDLTEMERRGRVVKLITALKQICNHPGQYLGEPGPIPGRSGKLARTTEMMAEVVATDERALIFTQYRAMGELLARHLAAELRLPAVPFLHGGVAREVRDAMVADFQDSPTAPPLLIVSLRAGGTGLNLTRATHVLHFDRWWNPAVEDQATDRAYRIGQTRNVYVHKLVTGGTLEERISDILERKRTLAESVIGDGETWLTEMNTAELRQLVELSDMEVE